MADNSEPPREWPPRWLKRKHEKAFRELEQEYAERRHKEEMDRSPGRQDRLDRLEGEYYRNIGRLGARSWNMIFATEKAVAGSDTKAVERLQKQRLTHKPKMRL